MTIGQFLGKMGLKGEIPTFVGVTYYFKSPVRKEALSWFCCSPLQGWDWSR